MTKPHILVDTHVVLWLVGGDNRVGSEALARIERASSVYVSAATMLEIAIKSMLGKLDVPDDFEQRIWTYGFAPLAIEPRHADGLRSSPDLARHDPFDRILLSQASIERLDLFTVDRVLLGLDLPFVVDASR